MAGAVDIYIDLEALQELATKLSQIYDALDKYSDDVQAYDVSLGSDSVKKQLDSFGSGWKDGRTKIKNNIKKLESKVKGVADTYAKQERDLAKAATPSGGSGGSGPVKPK